MAGQFSCTAPSHTLTALTAGCPKITKLVLLCPVNKVLFLLTLTSALLVMVAGTVHGYVLLSAATLLLSKVQLEPLSVEYSMVKLLPSLPYAVQRIFSISPGTNVSPPNGYSTVTDGCIIS